VSSPPDAIDLAGGTWAEVERKLITDTLDQTGGNREKAAQMLGVCERAVSRKVEKYRLAGKHGTTV